MNPLIARFDNVMHDMWDPHLPPTEESIRHIERHFGIRLPSLLLEFAKFSKSHSSFFLGLGPDFDHFSHIIDKNRMVRTDKDWLEMGKGIPAPDSLVFVTESFMEDFFWCLDINQSGPDYPVVLWRPDEDLNASSERYPNFESFIAGTIRYYEERR